MRNDLPILPIVDERPDTARRTLNYPVDLTAHLRSMHWSRASAVYEQHQRLFRQVAQDLDYSQRGMRLRDKLASLN